MFKHSIIARRSKVFNDTVVVVTKRKLLIVDSMDTEFYKRIHCDADRFLKEYSVTQYFDCTDLKFKLTSLTHMGLSCLAYLLVH